MTLHVIRSRRLAQQHFVLRRVRETEKKMRRSLRLIRNIAIAIVAALAVLAGVLLFNVLNLSSRQLQVAAVPRAEVDAQGAATRLAEAIRFQTISNYSDPDADAEALRGLQSHLEKSFPAFHAAATRESVATYSLLYTWQGSDPDARPIALLAHQDVVPVAPGTAKDWQHPPFDGVVAGGFIWGRGSWDDKGNLYAMLEAAEQMIKAGFRPKRTIYFAFGHDEEVGGLRGAKAIAALLASRGVRLDYVLDEGLLITEGLIKGLDRPAALIGVAEKGYATLVLTAHATPGHSSMPPRDTAIGMMSAALARLEDHRLPTQIRGAVRKCSTRWPRKCEGSTASRCRICGCSSRSCCANSKRADRPRPRSALPPR
jgi:carboxypeptidase PM20D1